MYSYSYSYIYSCPGLDPQHVLPGVQGQVLPARALGDVLRTLLLLLLLLLLVLVLS